MTSTTMSSTNLGVRFCGFPPLDPSLMIPPYLSFVTLGQPLKLFLLLPMVDSLTPRLQLVYEHWMMVLLKPLMILKVVIVVDLSMFVFVHHHHACTSICVWTSYMSYFIALHMLMLCLNYCCQLWWSAPSCFICCSYYFLFYSYIKLISFFGLKGTCCVTTPRIAIPNGFILPFMYF